MARSRKVTVLEWVEALESGTYKRGTGYLRKLIKFKNGNEKVQHCCLGVLADLKGEKWEEDEARYTDNEATVFTATKNGNLTSLKDTILPRDLQSTLADMNDDGGSFKQIAKWIRKNFPAEGINMEKKI